MSREIADRFKGLAKRMEDLPEAAGVALAVVVTQRLMDDYLLQPVDRRSSFVAPWAEMMPQLWMAVTSPSAKLKRTLKMRLEDYMEEFLGQTPIENEQAEYADDAGYACMAAIEAYCGNGKAVAGAPHQLLADAQSRAQRISMETGECMMSDEGEARLLRLQRLELDRVEAAIVLLEREEFSLGMLPQLQDLIANKGEES